MEGDIQISVRKTTVRKFQKAAISNDKIAAITGQSEQTLRDYATTDMEDHQKIKILSSKKSDVVAVQPARVLQLLSQQSAGLPSSISQCPPQFVFNNCTVYCTWVQATVSLLTPQWKNANFQLSSLHYKCY